MKNERPFPVLTFCSTGLNKLRAKILRNLRIISRERYRLASNKHHAAKVLLRRPKAGSFPPDAFLYVEFESDRGIGNRLKVLASNLLYFGARKIRCRWPKEGWVTASFHDLFSTSSDIEIRDVSEEERSLAAKEARCPALYDEIGGGGVLFLPPEDYNENVVENDPRNLSEATKQSYREIFRKFSPSKEVSERLKNFTLPPNFVSVQIRNNKDWTDAGRKDPVEPYIEKMRAFPSDTVFFLSAMNQETASKIRSVFKDRVLELPGKDYRSMVDAVCDMFILAKGREGIYAFGSTFCEVAWWLGGAKQPFSLIGSKSSWKKKKK